MQPECGVDGAADDSAGANGSVAVLAMRPVMARCLLPGLYPVPPHLPDAHVQRVIAQLCRGGREQASPWATLPTAVMANIGHFLEPADRVRAANVSLYWYYIFSAPEFWRRIADNEVSSDINDTDLIAMARLAGANLQELSLSQCMRITDLGILGVLRHCPMLVRISLHGDQVCDGIIDGIVTHSKALQELSLTNCPHVSRRAWLQLAQRCPLRSFELHECANFWNTGACVEALGATSGEHLRRLVIRSHHWSLAYVRPCGGPATATGMVRHARSNDLTRARAPVASPSPRCCLASRISCT